MHPFRNEFSPSTSRGRRSYFELCHAPSPLSARTRGDKKSALCTSTREKDTKYICPQPLARGPRFSFPCPPSLSPLKHDRNHPLPPDGKGSTSFPKNQNRPLPQDLGVTCAQSTQICAHEGTRNPSGSSVIFLLGMYTILNRDPTLRDLQFSHLFGIFLPTFLLRSRGQSCSHST